jgi:hypothetical protein
VGKRFPAAEAAVTGHVALMLPRLGGSSSNNNTNNTNNTNITGWPGSWGFGGA